MAVPKQVQDQADLADKLIKDQAEEGKTEKNEDLKLVPASEDDKDVQAEKSTPDKDKPTDQPQEDFEQKYKVLKGKYDAEVMPLQSEVRTLRQRTTELGDLLAKIPKDPEPKKDVPVDAKTFLSKDELSKFEEAGYDESDLNVLAVLAQRISEKNVAPIVTNIKNIAKSTAVSKKDRFWRDLDNTVKDRESLEADDTFSEFANSKAPYVNGTRQQVLEAAAKRLDLNTVIEIYDDFRKTRKKPAPKADLGKQVEPGSGTGAQSLPVQGKLYTRGEIRKFYADVSRGDYRYDPERAEKMEKDILLASTDGRIRP